MKKIFDTNGELIIRFAKDSKDQIMLWLEGVKYDYAIKYAKEVNDEVFGIAYEFPCTIKNII